MSDGQFEERDLDRNEDPEQIAGAVTGAGGVGIGGAIGLAALGPVGAVIGALAGAAGGWWLGKGFQGAVHDLDREENRFRRAHEHAGANRPFDEARHGYQLGYLAGRNPRYDSTPFTEAEKELRAAWIEAHKEDDHPVGWDAVRDDAKAGYELGRDPTRR